MLARDSRTAARPQPARGEATRNRVLDAAVACIAEEGFRASNLSRIATRAGVTTGAIQHQFGDKATLLAEVVERGFERMVGEIARGPVGSRSLEERVHWMVRALWQGYEAASTRASLEILFAMRGNDTFQRRSRAFLAGMVERVDRLWMGTFWDAGCDRAHHVEAQRLVFTTLDGLALERILMPGERDPAPDLLRLAGGVVDLLGDATPSGSE